MDPSTEEEEVRSASLADRPRAGRQSTFVNPANKEIADTLIRGIVVLVAAAHCSRKEGVRKRSKEKSPNRREHQIGLGNTQTLNQILALDDHNNFEMLRTIKTKRGSKKCRSKQSYAGLEVFGAGVIYSINDNQELTGSLSGEIVTGIEDDIPDFSACMLDENELLLLGKYIASILSNSTSYYLEKSQRIIYIDETVKAILAYIVELHDDNTSNEPSRPYIIVGACNSNVYCNVERITKQPIAMSREDTQQSSMPRTLKDPTPRRKRQTCSEEAFGIGGNPKTSDINYGTEPLCLDVNRVGSTCSLESSTVKVVDLHQSNTRSGSIYSYDCNTPDDAVNEAKSANLDAFFFGGTVYDFFETLYGMAPLSFQLLLYVHYGVRYENAFWDGKSMTFGDGDTIFYPLVALDVMAHEIAHGITEQNSGLVYSKQSGGINEAFSDITGEAVKKLASFHAQADPPIPNDWMVGSNVIKAANRALRYFDDPTKDGRSISHIRDYTDSIDVHLSSGIYNKAFYELVQTQGVDMQDAYGIFLDANMIYWGATTGFKDGACGVKEASEGFAIDTNKIDAAFAVVGIDTSCCGVSPETLETKITDLTVSPTINPCYALLPRQSERRFIRITATSESKSSENIAIKILDDHCGITVVETTESVKYKLPRDGSESVVCFSAGTELNDVIVTSRYCRRRRCPR